MLETYLYKKYIESKKEHAHHNQKSNDSNRTSIMNFLAMCVSLWFYFDCNKTPSLNLLWAVCCPYCYIFYHFANLDRCVDARKQLATEAAEEVVAAAAPAAPAAPVAAAAPVAPATGDQYGGYFETSSISSLGY